MFQQFANIQFSLTRFYRRIVFRNRKNLIEKQLQHYYIHENMSLSVHIVVAKAVVAMRNQQQYLLVS